MKQLIIIILQGLFNAVCNRIDNSFGNNMSVDAVCVLTSLFIVNCVVGEVYSLGINAYNVLQSKAKECLLVSIVLGGVMGLVLFIFSNWIPYVFSLTATQRVLFSKCLKVRACYCVLATAGDFMERYLLIKCKYKKQFLNDVVFWTIMFLSDAWVVASGRELPWLIGTTGVSYFVYCTTILFSSGILKENFQWSSQALKEIFKHGGNVCLERLFNRVGSIVCTLYASHLGTKLYAIHGICYSVLLFAEGFSVYFNTFQIIQLKKVEKSERFALCKKLNQKYGAFIVTLSYLSVPIILLVLHGKVNYWDCFLYSLLYCSDLIPFFFFESAKSYLTVQQQSKFLRYSGIVGVVVKIVFIGVCYCSSGNLFMFAFIYPLEQLARAVYLYWCSVRTERKLVKGKF